MQKLRVDRWLWNVRFFKTRSLAARAVQAGHVRIEGQRTKPAREIAVGDALSVSKGPIKFEISVAELPVRRLSASEAARCYVEAPDARARRETRLAELKAARASRPPTPGRPDKRTRRLMRSRKAVSE